MLSKKDNYMREKISGIYKITCLVNGKVYIGQSSNLTKRLTDHKGMFVKGNHKSILLQEAYNKYGPENFTYEIIELCPQNKLEERERFYLKQLGWPNPDKLFNVENGGNKGKKLGEETKEKIRQAHIGLKVSDETKTKISKTTTGKPKSTETRQKISKARLGTHVSPETLEKMRYNSSGERNWHYGQHVPEEIKAKIRASNPNTKVVMQFTKDGKFIAEYLGGNLAQQKTGISAPHIRSCCCGKRKSAGGYIWKYKEKDAN